SRPVTIKVHNEPVNYLLTAKMQPLQPIPTQLLPENLLLGCHLLLQFVGALHLHWFHRLPDDNVPRRHAGFSCSPSPLRGGGRGEGLCFSPSASGRGGVVFLPLSASGRGPGGGVCRRPLSVGSRRGPTVCESP